MCDGETERRRDFFVVLNSPDMYSKAIVRRPGKNFAEGITTSTLGKPDFKKAREQHSAYCDALMGCGLELTVHRSSSLSCHHR
jgi:hypothetical protein